MSDTSILTGAINIAVYKLDDVVEIRGYNGAGKIVKVNDDGTYDIEIPGEIPPVKKNIETERMTSSTKPIGRIKEKHPGDNCIGHCFSGLLHCCYIEHNVLYCCACTGLPVCKCKCNCRFYSTC